MIGDCRIVEHDRRCDRDDTVVVVLFDLGALHVGARVGQIDPHATMA